MQLPQSNSQVHFDFDWYDHMRRCCTWPGIGTIFSKISLCEDFVGYMIRAGDVANSVDRIREIQPSLQVPRAETKVERFTARQHVAKRI